MTDGGGSGPGPEQPRRSGAGTGDRAAAGALWTAVGNWGNQLLTLLVFTVLARLLAPEDFGIVAFASVFLALVKVVAEQGMADAIVQRPDIEDTHLDTAFWTSVGVGAALGGALAASSWWIATVVDRPDAGPVLAWLSASIAIAGFGNVQRGVLTRGMDFRGLALRTLAASLGGGAVGIGMAVAGFGVWSLVGQTIAFELFGVAALWASSPWRPGRHVSRVAFRELARFGAGVVGFKVLNFFNTRSDNFVIGLRLGATALGFYVVAYRLLQLLLNVTTAIIGTVAFPLFSRAQRDPEAVLDIYYRVTRLTALLAFPAFVGVIVVAPELVRAVFGADWESSVPVVRILAVGGALQSVTFVNSTVIKSMGRPGWRVWIIALSAAVNLVAFVVAVRWGIEGVAWAFTLGAALVGPVWWLTARRLVALRVGRYGRQLVSPSVASAVMAGVVLAARPSVDDLPAVLALAVLVPLGVAVFAGALRLLDRRLYAEATGLSRAAVRGLVARSPEA